MSTCWFISIRRELAESVRRLHDELTQARHLPSRHLPVADPYSFAVGLSTTTPPQPPRPSRIAWARFRSPMQFASCRPADRPSPTFVAGHELHARRGLAEKGSPSVPSD